MLASVYYLFYWMYGFLITEQVEVRIFVGKILTLWVQQHYTLLTIKRCILVALQVCIVKVLL